jgi:hypothetical protein
VVMGTGPMSGRIAAAPARPGMVVRAGLMLVPPVVVVTAVFPVFPVFSVFGVLAAVLVVGRGVRVVVWAGVQAEALPCCAQQEEKRPDEGDRALRNASVHGLPGNGSGRRPCGAC